MSNRKLPIKLLALLVLTCVLLAIPSFADSQARIVRLSDVVGNVQIDRNTGQGYEKAFLNLPVTEGMKLRSSDDGRAEVEFEDGSTLRITPGTVIEFPELSLRSSGDKLSTVKLQEGTAYLKFAASKGDQFTLIFGREKLSLINPAHLRVQMGDTEATLAVFKGDVQVEGPSGTVQVSKKQSVSFNLADQDRYTVASNLEQDPYDAWDKQQEQYHQRYLSSSNSYSAYSPYAYGTSDLNYYGNFMNVPGYGMMWQPYFAGAGWDPFMNGAWSYYPGFGYSWISAYPWGWTPYHYGNWRFVPGFGWMWQPGGSWAGLSVPRVVNPPARFLPPQPPATGGNTTVVVNRGPLTTMPGVSPRQMVIRNDSAGLGIPRGSIKNLGKVSQQVKQEGSATARIHTAPVVNLGAVPAATAAPASTSRPAAMPRTVAPRMSTPAPHSSGTPRSTPSSHPSSHPHR
jgi:hypothetical protein